MNPAALVNGLSSRLELKKERRNVEQVPKPPDDTSDRGWQEWADKHYPYDEQWEVFLRTRREKPKPLSVESLNDIRGISRTGYPGMAATFARMWFNGRAKQPKLDESKEAEKQRERNANHKTLVKLACAALAGKLGKTKSEREDAAAIAQSMFASLRPEVATYDDLEDWALMHKHARAIARGENPPRPQLARDRRAAAQRQTTLIDIEDGIGATPAGRPR